MCVLLSQLLLQQFPIWADCSTDRITHLENTFHVELKWLHVFNVNPHLIVHDLIYIFFNQYLVCLQSHVHIHCMTLYVLDITCTSCMISQLYRID